MNDAGVSVVQEVDQDPVLSVKVLEVDLLVQVNQERHDLRVGLRLPEGFSDI